MRSSGPTKRIPTMFPEQDSGLLPEQKAKDATYGICDRAHQPESNRLFQIDHMNVCDHPGDIMVLEVFLEHPVQR